METKKIRIETILAKLPEKSGTNAKGPWTIYKVRASVAGAGDAVLASYKPIEIQDGAEVEVFEREHNGEIEYEITRRSAGGQGQGQGPGGGWGGGRGYGKPAYTAAEFFRLELFVHERVSKRFPPMDPTTAEPFKNQYATMLIQAAEHGVKIEGDAPAATAAPGTGTDPKAAVRELVARLDFSGQDAKKAHVDREMAKPMTTAQAAALLTMINGWHLPGARR
jgi:hypothetical protein